MTTNSQEACGVCQTPLELGPSGNWLDRQRQMVSTEPFFHYHLTLNEVLRAAYGGTAKEGR